MESLRLLEKFLLVLSDPEGGEALYRLHTADAPLRRGAAVALAAQTDCDEFARLHREICLEGGEALPRFDRPSLSHAQVSADTGEGVAWFEVMESREQRAVTVALGYKIDDGTPRVGWCMTVAQVGSASYRDGLLQSLADYPWMRANAPARARALLDASYFRRYWRPPITFSTLPDARFSCQMSAACCKHDYEITLPVEAQLIVDSIPWEAVHPPLAGTRLPVRPDGKLQLKTLSETCRFLDPHRQCYIHKTLGQQPFGACSVFPFAFARTPEGIAVGLSPICGSARLGFGVPPQSRLEDLRERLVHAEPRQPAQFRLAPALEIAWERFRDIEKVLCELLGTTQLPMRRRLYVAARLLGALKDNEPLEMDRWAAEPAVTITDDLRAAIHGMLAKVMKWDRATLQALPRALPDRLFELEVEEPAALARVLQNTLYCKVYSYPLDLTTAHNFLIVLYLLTLIMQAATRSPLPEAMWQELGSLGVHGLLGSVLHEGVPEGFRTLFGTCEFGLWLLSA